MQKIKLIIFDWDDVFTLGSRKGYFKCYHEALSELGVELDPEEEEKRIIAKWGQPHREEFRELLKERPELLDDACKIYEEKLFGDTFVDCLSLLDGAVPLLESLSKQFVLCIATGLHPKIFRERIVPKFGVPDVFAQVVSSYDLDDPEKTKPHPHMLEFILETQKMWPDEAVMVGDAEADMLMARAANIVPIAVLTGHLTEEGARDLGIDYVIEDVTRLPGVLGDISNRISL